MYQFSACLYQSLINTSIVISLSSEGLVLTVSHKKKPQVSGTYCICGFCCHHTVHVLKTNNSNSHPWNQEFEGDPKIVTRIILIWAYKMVFIWLHFEVISQFTWPKPVNDRLEVMRFSMKQNECCFGIHNLSCGSSVEKIHFDSLIVEIFRAYSWKF